MIIQMEKKERGGRWGPSHTVKYIQFASGALGPNDKSPHYTKMESLPPAARLSRSAPSTMETRG